MHSPSQRALLGLLLTDPGAPVHRDTIIDVLWGQTPPNTAASLIQAHVSRLRKLLGFPRCCPEAGDAIVSVGCSYRLRLADGKLDLLVFRRLAARAAAAHADGDVLGACDRYEQATGLWRGYPLADVDLLRGQPGVAELSRQLTDVFLRYARLACSIGLHDRALPRLHALAAAEPLNERAHALLMVALAGTGQQAAAVRVYENLRSRLDRELGVYPSVELAETHLRVLRQDIPAQGIERWRAPAILDHEVPRQLPTAIRCFVGRRDELVALSGLLDQVRPDAGGVVIAALTGMAGVGKTALGVDWAHRVADRFPDGQLFVNLHGFGPSGQPMKPSEAVCRFLSALGVPSVRIPPDAEEQSARYRSLLAKRRMLILLDNARDAEQVRPLLPGSPGCLVLVTSRNQLTGLAADGAHMLPLGVLPERDAYALLVEILGAERARAEATAVSELITLCARLPLALRSTAARATARPGLPLAALAAEMRDEQRRLEAMETRDAPTSVRMVFSWSLARLSKRAARMFRLLGMHPGPDVTVAAAASLAGLPRDDAYLALAELCDAHLVTEQPTGRYTHNDLLRVYAAEAARAEDGDAERRAAVLRLLDHYLHTASAAASLLYPHIGRPTRDRPQPGVLPEEIADSRQAEEWFDSERHVWHRLMTAQLSALRVAAVHRDLAGRALASLHLGLLRFRLGEVAEACRHLEDAFELYRAQNDQERAVSALTLLARQLAPLGLIP